MRTKMQNNGLRIESDLASVPTGANCALIIRHADRAGELNQIVSREEGLNQVGRERSVALGSYLTRFSEIRSYSSPIGRCIETCELVSKGFGNAPKPEPTEFLGMSAPFMTDPKGAYVKMREIGLLGFIDAYVHDSLDRRLVLPCREGTEMMFNYAIERIRGMKGGVGIFVTHDMIITPAMSYYFGYDFKGKGLAPFLDGIVLYQKGDGYVARHNGKEIDVGPDGRPLP